MYVIVILKTLGNLPQKWIRTCLPDVFLKFMYTEETVCWLLYFSFGHGFQRNTKCVDSSPDVA